MLHSTVILLSSAASFYGKRYIAFWKHEIIKYFPNFIFIQVVAKKEVQHNQSSTFGPINKIEQPFQARICNQYSLFFFFDHYTMELVFPLLRPHPSIHPFEHRRQGKMPTSPSLVSFMKLSSLPGNKHQVLKLLVDQNPRATYIILLWQKVGYNIVGHYELQKINVGR